MSSRGAVRPTRRAKSRGVDGAVVFTFAGDRPPADSSGWKFSGATSRTTMNLRLLHGLPPGAKLWVTAQWFNPTKQRGRAAAPVATRVAGGWMKALAA